jgi:hypothetical protein
MFWWGHANKSESCSKGGDFKTGGYSKVYPREDIHRPSLAGGVTAQRYTQLNDTLSWPGANHFLQPLFIVETRGSR